MQQPSKSSNDVDLLSTEVETEEEVEVVVAPKKAAAASKPRIFGDCRLGRHGLCNISYDDGGHKGVCECKCENHGADRKPLNLNTPLHNILMKVSAYNKAGKMYSESDEYQTDVKNGTIDTASTVELKYEPQQIPLKAKGIATPVLNVEEYDTLEELEKKRL